MFRALAIIAAGFAAAVPAEAQTASAEGTFSFNLFDFAGVTLSDVYTFDDSYTERFGIEVPVPFRVDVPRRDGVGPSPMVAPMAAVSLGSPSIPKPMRASVCSWKTSRS